MIENKWPQSIAADWYKKGLLQEPFLVPSDVLFSNSMLEDMEKIWALRDIIPDPTKIPLKSDIKEKGN